MNNLLSQLKQIYQQPATAPATHSLLIGRKQTRRLLIGWTHLGKQAIGQELRPCRVDYIDNHLFVSLYRMFENLSSNMDKLYYLYYLHVHSGRTQSAKTNKYHSGYDKKNKDMIIIRPLHPDLLVDHNHFLRLHRHFQRFHNHHDRPRE